MQEWNEVRTDDDIEAFMQKTGCLHDSVIVSVSYNSGCYAVDRGLACMPDKEENTLSVIIDHSWTGRLELLFIGVRYFNVYGYSDTYSKEIYECGLEFRSDLMDKERDERLIVWTDGGDVDLKNMLIDLRESGQTFIIAEKLKWRYINEYDHKQEL